MKIFTKLMAMIFIISGFTFAQSNHSITIDGTNDFTTSTEQFQTTSGTDLYAYITWDATNIYFGFSGSSPAGTVTDDNRVYHIYIDTDPTGSNGTTDGETWRWDPTLPFNADYHYAFKTVDNTEYKRKYSSGSWSNATITTSNNKGGGYWELSIKRSDIGSPSEIKVLMYVEEDWDNTGYICGGLPSDLFTNTKTQGAITFNSHYQGYTLDNGYTPNDDNAKDYVMRKNYAYLSFDGSNDYVKYSDDATLGLLDGATDYTIEAWIYPVDGTVAEYDRVLQRYYSFAIVMYDGNDDGKVKDWYFQVYDGSAWQYFNTEGDATLTLDDWNHVAVINNSSDGSLKLYVNGTDVTTTGGYSNQSMQASVDNDNLYIGQKGNAASYFGGYIDEVRLKKVAVNPSDLHYHTTDNAYMSDASTAGLFHFDEGGTSHVTKNVPSGTNANLGSSTDGDSGEPAWETGVSALPLPVELKSFTATVKGNKVELNWVTATEVNNYGFQIERKRLQGESNWDEIGFVQGHGNSNSTKYYTYIDNPFEKGSYSYRLKQIDLDGAFKYSEAVTVDLGTVTKFELKQNYPNPFNPTTEISFDVPKESRVKLSVYNALGQKVADLLNEKLSAGTHRVRFDGSNLSSGIYFYRMQSNGFTAIKKMILMK